jgi:hypothetical protein
MLNMAQRTRLVTGNGEADLNVVSIIPQPKQRIIKKPAVNTPLPQPGPAPKTQSVPKPPVIKPQPLKPVAPSPTGPTAPVAHGVPSAPGAPKIARKSPNTSPNVDKQVAIVRTKFKQILFCEPYTQDVASLAKVDFKSCNNPCRTGFKVTEEFYPVLSLAPAKATKKTGNAYIFGEKFALTEYKLIGEHGNDGAQTGFIDFEMLVKHGPCDMYDKSWTDAYNNFEIGWDNRNALKKVQKVAPFVLWTGQTVGGDVGARLWAHFRPGTKHIDGLIVDNRCLFDNTTP